MPAASSRPPAFHPIHLGLDLSRAGAVPASWTGPGPRSARQFDAARTHDLVTAAERGQLDLVAFGDTFALRPTGRQLRGHLDSAITVSRFARKTSRIGLVASLDPDQVPREHLAPALASLDRATGGRAAWQLEPPAGFAARVLPVVDEVRGELGLRVPPLVVVRASTRGDLRAAAARADVVRIRATDLGQASAMRQALRGFAADVGRDPDSLRVLLETRVVLSGDEASARTRAELTGVTGEPVGTLTHIGTPGGLATLMAQAALDDLTDGFLLEPANLVVDVAAITQRLVPALRRAGLFRAGDTATSLRETLGLSRPTARDAAARPSRAARAARRVAADRRRTVISARQPGVPAAGVAVRRARTRRPGAAVADA